MSAPFLRSQHRAQTSIFCCGELRIVSDDVSKAEPSHRAGAKEGASRFSDLSFPTQIVPDDSHPRGFFWIGAAGVEVLFPKDVVVLRLIFLPITTRREVQLGNT